MTPGLAGGRVEVAFEDENEKKRVPDPEAMSRFTFRVNRAIPLFRFSMGFVLRSVFHSAPRIPRR